MWKTILLSILVSVSSLKKDTLFRAKIEEIKEEDSEQWGIVNIRPNAHLFYWFYYSTHEDGYENRPIVLWIQGGPGGSATGLGNFGIIGPVNQSLQPRERTWVQSANVLFVDSPVGSGYSWCDTVEDCYTENGEEIADDMSTFFKVFMAANPHLQDNEFYFFGQSYGAKSGVPMVRRIYNDIQQGELNLNLKGLAMGNPWIHPVDSTLTWGGLLHWMSAVDDQGKERVDAKAKLAQEAAEAGDWVESTFQWEAMRDVVWNETNDIDIFNILKYTVVDNQKSSAQLDVNSDPIKQMEEWDLFELMNGPIREKLGIIPDDVIWGAGSDLAYSFQRGDFMKDVMEDVDWILNNTDIHVIVYQGQLDLVGNIKGARDWMKRIQWSGVDNFYEAARTAYVDPIDGQTDTYVRAYGKFKFYEIMRGGHALPADAPDAALRMLNRIIDDLDN